jgi:conjugal transfer pilus assembly protein TraV
MKKRLLIATLLPLLATGCASTFNTADNDTFSCPGMPQGIICKTPFAVYKSTNQMPAATDSDMPIGQTVKGVRSGDDRGNVASPEQVSANSASLPGLTPASAIATNSRPIRTPAEVMRIWIAPWTDSKDDLHYPSYLFTEVQARRWSFGKTEFGGQGLVVPHHDLVAASTTSKQAESSSSGGKNGVLRSPEGGAHRKCHPHRTSIWIDSNHLRSIPL